MHNIIMKKIKSDEIRDNLMDAYHDLPNYFCKVPASSSGKYHPKFSLGEGGLLRHTKFAVEIAIELFRIVKFTQLEKDIIISALILHDGRKHGLEESKHTVKDHADIQADYLDEFWSNEFEGRKQIIECIRTHMGQWSVNVAPRNKVERFVHTCDYLASRKTYDKYYE